MSKKIVNALKAKESKYTDLRAKAITSDGWNQINYGRLTHADLHREYNLTINGQKITNEFINGLESKYKNLISKDENGGKNYRTFLKAIFTEMFEYAGAKVPNDLIIEELITNYNQSGYTSFSFYDVLKPLQSFNLQGGGGDKRMTGIECNDHNCLKFTFSLEDDEISYMAPKRITKVCDLSCSVEFKLKCKDGNVAYEDGKVLLAIPKELENYKAGDDKFLDKLTDIVNKIIEYLKRLCEKLGFKFDTRIEYDSERNIKIEYKLGKPLKVIDKPDISTVKDLKLEVSNL